ncbi:aldose 1-epimerase family protein [Bacteriovorax sp. BSW11_IV]|uniref:aldose 1-epimerase family protein n=1 Tax=Bacteriovorax sp. BSW11_IV TaxID=1353529 RepID=UPI0003FBC893|nr:aldose 1-epimerase family protein [Bacteriovorax sp. BSW11_IV]
MKEIKISSHYISAKISSQGAELQSLRDRESSVEYLWQGHPKFWSRRAPVLFPIVGSLRDDQYRIGRKYYVMGRHGFARDQEFEVIEQEKDSVKFRLMHTEESLTYYPFKFSLDIRYKCYGPKLIVTFEVKNLDRKEMFFSLGWHPAFNIPLKHGELEDHYIEFEHEEEQGAYYLHHDLIDFRHPDDKTMLKDGRRIFLTEDLFKKDALIFKDLTSHKVSLKSSTDDHSVGVEFGDIPYLGLWAPEGAPFVCIEPWFGVADHVDSNNDFFIKEGVICLDMEKSFKTEFVLHLN